MALARLPVVFACAVLMPAAGLAQSAPSSEPAASTSATEPEPRAASARHERRIYFGMWTMHLRQDVIALDNNWAVGMTWRGFFGATFMNSFGRRAFTGGLQRRLLTNGGHPIAASLGYRLGFVTGYDGRFMRLARKTPVLPLVQPFVTIDVQHIGFEVSYSFVVVSAALSYLF
jgi:hypothetical protein